VVAAIDVTHQARRVAERARLLAEVLDAGLTLLHVTETWPEALVDPDVAGLLRSHERDLAAETAEWVRGRTTRPVTMLGRKGNPAWEIVKEGKTADLVVVGSSSVDSARVGPVTRRVAEMARNDVVVVKRHPRAEYRRVLITVDLSPASSWAVELAHRLAPRAEKTLLFVLPTRSDLMMASAGMFPEEIELDRKRRIAAAKQRLEEFAPGVDARRIVGDGPVLEVVAETVRKRSTDLVVAASRGAGATRMVLLGSVAEGLLEAVPSDVALARVSASFRRP
jgi:nucleotide-binding universal stress UspA family protein